MPRVVIVLPVFNHETYLEHAIGSLYAQDYSDFQIAAVDDGSQDGSLDMLNRHGRRLLVIESAHRGPAAARNAAIQATDSELVAFMDADDLCRPQRLRLEIERLESEKRDLVASALDFIDAHGRPLPGLWRCPAGASNDYWGALLERNWIGTPSVLVRRDVFYRTGLFDETFTHAEDYDLWLRIGQEHSIGYVDTALVQCRRHPTNTSKNASSHQRFERLALQKVEPAKAHAAFHRLYPDGRRQAEAWIWFLLRRGDPAFRREICCAIQQYPESPALRFAVGVFQYDCGEFEYAMKTFDSIKNRDVCALHNLGVIQARCGDPASAELQIREALRRRSDYHDARYNLAALQSGRQLRLTRRTLRQDPLPLV
jgi:GT2 family glycosyltransferase